LLGHALYDTSNPEHVRREHKSIFDAMGDRRIPDYLDIMLTRVRRAQPLLGILD